MSKALIFAASTFPATGPGVTCDYGNIDDDRKETEIWLYMNKCFTWNTFQLTDITNSIQRRDKPVWPFFFLNVITILKGTTIFFLRVALIIRSFTVTLLCGICLAHNNRRYSAERCMHHWLHDYERTWKRDYSWALVPVHQEVLIVLTRIFKSRWELLNFDWLGVIDVIFESMHVVWNPFRTCGRGRHVNI